MSFPDSSSRTNWLALTRPASLALVGASERNPFAHRAVANMAQLGFRGDLLFVNSRRERVFDTQCYPSLDALPYVPECVAISVPAPSVAEVVDLGLELGISAFVVNSAGFAEVGGDGLIRQQRLTERCRSAGASLIGPNCMGLVNLRTGVGTFGAPLPPTLRAGPVGVVSQSGSATVALMNAQRDVGFSVVVSSGNEAVTCAEEILEHFVEDAETRIIVAIVESLREPRRFVGLAHNARRAGKPVLALKIGTTPDGSAAAFSHTARLTGAARVYAAMFRDAGVVQVSDLDELVETLELFAHTSMHPCGNRIGLLGISGGELALAADIATSAGLVSQNPLDLGALPTSAESMESIVATRVAALDADLAIDIIAVAQDAQASLNAAQVPLYRQVMSGAASAAGESSKPVVVFTNVSAGLHPEVIGSARSAGLPVLQGAREALRAISHLAWYASTPCEEDAYQPDPIRFQRALGLEPRDARQLLTEYGVPVTRELFAATPAAAVFAARSIGFPVVLKVVSEDIVHKSDVGGVRLGLRSDSEVERAFEEIVVCASRARPDKRITGVLVAEQVPRGVELIIGISQEAQFGPVVLVGLGGVLVEVLDQVAVALPPVSPGAAQSSYCIDPRSSMRSRH